MDSLFTDEEVGMKEKVTSKEVASILGVSIATIRNWVRHEYLKPLGASGKSIFALHQVNELKTQLSTGQLDRLNRRANKKESLTKFIPVEYAAKSEVSRAVEHIVDVYNRDALELGMSLLAIVLNILGRHNLITVSTTKDDCLIQPVHETLETELQWWFKQAKKPLPPIYDQLRTCDLPVADDLLGIVYQSLVTEGAKSYSGSYFTPRVIVDSMVGEHLGEHSMLLDPCCGTGQFLLAAADVVSDPSNIWGFEVNEIAAHIARLNMIVRFPEVEFSPHIYSVNALLELPSLARKERLSLPEFDAVITNPPWGAHFTGQELSKAQALFPAIKSNEAFSMFMMKGLQLLKDGGVLSYILPEAILNIKIHADIREVLLKSTALQTVKHLGRVFQNVYTPSVRIDVKKGVATSNNFIVVFGSESRQVEQNRLLSNPDYVFDTSTDLRDLAIFDKIYSRQYLTLQGNAEWAVGIVTGDNAKYLSNTGDTGYEPILTGKDIRRFIAEPAKKFIKFTPEKFQQVAPICRYRATEKLIYRFISAELVFAYDDCQTLSLNSANVVIPFLPGYSVKTVLAFLNSSLYQMLFQKKFGAFKILRGDIEKLPFPIISSDNSRDIVNLANALLSLEISSKQKKAIFDRLNNYIMDIFDLDEEQKNYVRSNAKMSAKLLPFK